MFRRTHQDRQSLSNLTLPVSREFSATMLDIERLPTTRFEPFVPDWQTIDWSADRPDIAPAVADGYARDAELIRNLPEAHAGEMARRTDRGHEEMIRVSYLFKADSDSKSACGTVWPPLLATGTPTAGTRLTASKLATSTRSGGTQQVTYDGHPLYLYADDRQPGDVNERYRAFPADT